MQQRHALGTLGLVLVLGLAIWGLTGTDAEAPVPQAGAAPLPDAAAQDGGAGRRLRPGISSQRKRVPDARAVRQVFAADRSIRGLVLDPEGQPQVGAEVVLELWPGDVSNFLDRARNRECVTVARQRSDQQGRFALPAQPGRPHRLVIEAADYPPARRAGVYAGNHCRVQLRPPARLSLRIADAEDRGISGAKLRIGRIGYPAEQTVHSGAEGEARIAGLGAGTYRLRVDADGFSSPRPIDLVLKSGVELRRELRLSPGAVLRGRVLDADTGQGLKGVFVGESSHKATETDAEGRFELRGFSDAYFDIEVRAAGYGIYSHRVRTRFGQKPSEVTLRLRRGRRAVGRVVAPDGSPVVGAYVAAAASDRIPWGNKTLQRVDWRSVRSDAQGQFEIPDLRADMRHTVVLQHPGFGTQIHDFPVHELDQRLVQLGTFRLRPAAQVWGVVVDENQMPVAGVQVKVFGHNADRQRRLLAGTKAAEQDAEHARLLDSYLASRELRSDTQGRFACRDLPQGEFELVASLRGKHQVVKQTIQVLAGQDLGGLRLQVFVGQQIRGKILVPDQGAVPKTYLSVDPEDGQQTSADIEVAADGSFVVDGLAPGRYRFTAYPYASADDKLRGRRFASRVFKHIVAGRRGVELRLLPVAK